MFKKYKNSFKKQQRLRKKKNLYTGEIQNVQGSQKHKIKDKIFNIFLFQLK